MHLGGPLNGRSASEILECWLWFSHHRRDRFTSEQTAGLFVDQNTALQNSRDTCDPPGVPAGLFVGSCFVMFTLELTPRHLHNRIASAEPCGLGPASTGGKCHAKSPLQTASHPSGSDYRVGQTGTRASRKTPTRARTRSFTDESAAGRDGNAPGGLGQLSRATGAKVSRLG
jgi:hypothetical protein